jgi:regulator of sigma E protease
MDVLTNQIPQFILCLSLLIVLHELGHFIPARLFKVRVEKFYLFFDPWFSLFKRKKGDTEYGIGWLPLGGYVKLSGMVDESMDTAQMKQAPKPWEFRTKPTWQRLIIMVGGVVVNLLLGLFIYAMIMFTWGRETLPFESMLYGVHPGDLMAQYGFEDGDRLVGAEGARRNTLDELNRALLLGDCRSIVVERNGERLTIAIPDTVSRGMMRDAGEPLFTPQFPFIVDSIIPGLNASRSTLRPGDQVVAVNAVPTPYFHQFQKAAKDMAGQEVVLGVLRNGEPVEVAVQVSEEGRIGVSPRDPLKMLPVVREEFGFFAAIPAGIEHGLGVLTGQARSMKLLGTKEGVQQIGGFWTILRLFGKWGDWQRFWSVTAMISIILAFMNILPIPALDGGHVVFLLYEMVTRRAPSQRVLEVAQVVGLFLVLGLLLLANGNDLLKWLTGRM